MNLPLLLLNRRRRGGTVFSPASLFASGEEGAWYEPSTTTAFADLGGFNLATYGQGVAHLVDKSKGATIEARRNLLAYTEEFENAYWTKTNLLPFGSGSIANATAAPDGTTTADLLVPTLTNTAHYVRRAITTSASTDYTLSCYVAAAGYSKVRLQNISLTSPNEYFEANFDLVAESVISSQAQNGGTLTGSPTITNVGNGFYRISVTGSIGSKTNSGWTVYVLDGSGNATFTGDGTSGIYIWGAQLETGATATAYQKITTGQTLSWLPGNHATQVTAGARPILARVPEGGRRNELSETDTLATQSVTVTAAQRTLSFTGTGTVTLTGASTAGPLVGTGAADRVSLTFTPSAGTLTLTVLGTTTDAQLELGAAATTYQSVADSLGYDVTEAGVTSLEYLSFDGSDDGMATASIDFTATDKMSVFAGVEILANQVGIISELSADYSVNTGSFASYVQDGATANYGINVRGTVTSNLNVSGGYTPPLKSVYSGLANISAPSQEIRVDGASAASAATSMGTGNFGNYPVYIGARNNASLRLDGKIFGLIVRGAASTAQEISQTETYLAAKSGVTLP